MNKLNPYSEEIEEKMTRYYYSLSEKERRRYAAIEAQKLGYGGVSYIVRLFGCHPDTLKRGYFELESQELGSEERIRKKGGGRKKCIEIIEGIDEAFLRVIDRHIAGSPMNESEKWTHLTRPQIVDLLWVEEKIKVSVTVIDQLLKKHNFRRRQAQKNRVTGNNPHRNEQFENIDYFIKWYQQQFLPVISMDTKKKEKIGCFYRAGKTSNQKPIEVYDHDWGSLAKGKVIPHGLYDLNYNLGYMNLGTSHDTNEFACDSIRHWWLNYGLSLYPLATSILLLCDGGGSNSSRSGLKVFSHIIDKVYETGRKVSQDFKKNMRIIFDEHIPQWNYVIKPN